MRTIRNKHVYVIACDLARNDLQLMLGRDLPYQVAHTNRDLPSQYWLPVFRNPHQVHLQVALRVRSQPIMSHANTLHETLLRLKARGSTIPDGDTKIDRIAYLCSASSLSLTCLWFATYDAHRIRVAPTQVRSTRLMVSRLRARTFGY